MPTSHRGLTVIRHTIVAALAIAALGTSAAALAQTAREAQLEARVAELERIVQQLVAEKQAAAAAAAGAPARPAQAASITPNSPAGTGFVFTGFIKADANFTDLSHGEIADNSTGRDFYVPGATPVGGADEGTDLNTHVKQSRINFGTDTVLEGGDKLMTRFEVDFFGSTLGNQRVTNTYAPVLRHAYVQWHNWLVGQTWSNFMDVATLPEAADFIGTTDGTTFVRQPQLRYTRGGFSLSAENPETTITPFGGGTAIDCDDNRLPDLTARYAWKGGWGHLAVAGLLRELKHETAGANAVDNSAWTAALSLSGKLMLGKDDLRFMLLGGNLGRYVGLNFANDAVLDSSGNLESIDGYAGFIAYRHLWTPQLRSTLSFAMEDYDNDVSLTGHGANKSSSSWTVNLFYTPIPKLDIGAEYRHAKREIESGADGSFDRLQLTTKYSF